MRFHPGGFATNKDTLYISNWGILFMLKDKYMKLRRTENGSMISSFLYLSSGHKKIGTENCKQKVYYLLYFFGIKRNIKEKLSKDSAMNSTIFGAKRDPEPDS